MKTPMKDIVKQAMVDVSEYDVELVDGKFRAVGDALVDKIYDLVAAGEGLALCFGASTLLAQHGMDVHHEPDAAVARDYLESVFRAFAGKVDVAKYTPVVMDYDRVASMDVDGFNPNKHFTPNSDHTSSREFLTTKCVHFDAATTFIGNIYGPNTNIDGGMPIVCNTRDYCEANGVDPADLVELMPHSYNVAVKEQYSDAILAEHSVGVDIDLHDDLVMVVLFNEVTGGLAHAGSRPQLTEQDKPGKRPIRHVELQFADAANLERWYHHYRLGMPEITVNVPGSPEHKRYHGGIESSVQAQSPVAVGN
ncbi:MAG TPA: hypothetical protein VJ851_03995 [Jatrophihabitans sp.]|nr:hypothetical protein [Jatrophihabitans sp.]